MGETDVWPQIESLYRSRFERFVRVARAVTGDRELALDAVQEGFADALRHAEGWSGRGPLEGWVWRCVVNRAHKARPRQQPVGKIYSNQHSDEGDPELRARLAALPERQRLVVFLRYFADLGYREIAETLEIEVGTVSATLNAAHTSLRAAIEEAHA